jgi:hypothetical protein
MDVIPVRLDELIDHVGERHPQGDVLEHLGEAVRVSEHLGDIADHLVGHFVDEARKAGASWTSIGRSLGVSKQAVQQRFVGKRSDDATVYSRFTPRARRAVAAAERAARDAGHDQVGSAHVVLGLLDENDGLAAQAIEALDVSPDTLRVAVRATLGPAADEVPEHLPFSPDAKRVRDLTVREALRLGHNYVGTEHILLGVLSDEDGQVAQVLARHGVTKERAEAWIVAVLYGMRRRSDAPSA